MVVLMVLGTMGIILYQILSFSRDAVVDFNYFATVRDREVSYYIGKSAIEIVKNTLLKEDDTKTDSFFDLWATDIAPFHLKEGFVDIKIEDEERYFNPRFMLKEDGEVEEKYQQQFQRLLEALSIDEGKANAVVDWMDENSIPTLPGGVEGSTQLTIKNAPLDSVPELLFVPGIEKEDYEGKVLAGTPIPGLKDVLTVRSSGRVNINTAPLPVLMSLDEDITENLAVQIIERRKNKPFEYVNDLSELAGYTQEMVYRINNLAGVTSQTFRIIAVVSIGLSKTRIVAVYDRESEDKNLKYFKIE